MNTRLLMKASALLLGTLGVAAIFAPHEILALVVVPVTIATSVALQVVGALYFGFALLNWLAQGNLIGGIYSRPVAAANLAHFGIGALALAKAAVAGERAVPVLVGAVLYVLFAILFGIVLRTHPTPLAATKNAA